MSLRSESFAVIISRGLWRSIEVSIEPRTCSHSLRSFRSHAEARAYADDLAQIEGWPVCDRTGDGQ